MAQALLSPWASDLPCTHYARPRAALSRLGSLGSSAPRSDPAAGSADMHPSAAVFFCFLLQPALYNQPWQCTAVWAWCAPVRTPGASASLIRPQGAAHVVLVGDHRQLPPVVQSGEAQAGGLGTSLFERLITAGAPSALLQVQYRMHPALAVFPNRRFYGGQLLDGVSAPARPPPAGLPWPTAAGLLFIDVVGQEAMSQGGSKSNTQEAEVAGRVVAALLRGGLRPGDIGVVTPYAAQVQLLTNQVQRVQQVVAPQPPVDAAPLADNDAPFAAAPAVVEVKTVDGYQGREKEAIVFSAVRSNTQGQVGFLEDCRRLNVAITRARRALVLVGNAATLGAGDAHWAALLVHLQDAGCVVLASQLRLAAV